MSAHLFFSLSFLLFLAESPASEPHAVEVRFSNAGAELAGTLWIPEGEGPFPGAVIVHGSGTSPRSNPWTAAYVDALVARGVAVLHPDKRGSGESGGDWRTAGFETLAGDALAALDVLREHAQVDTARVGLIGFSQGGHVVPLAADMSDRVRFAVDVSGSVVPMVEQVNDEVRQMGIDEGLTPEQMDALARVQSAAAGFALEGHDWEGYAAALADAKEGALAGTQVIAGFPTDPDASVWQFLRTVGDFDPMPHWRALDVPVLFLYGGRDDNVDTAKSARIIVDELLSEGPRYSLLFFSENGHGLYREDAMDFLARWIRDGGVD